MTAAADFRGPVQLKLWDFGWLDYRDIQIPKCDSLAEMLAAYISSSSFGASFARPDPDVSPELHGPFKRDDVLASDFYVLTRRELQEELESVRSHPDFGAAPSIEQWQPVEDLMLELHAANTWTVALRLTERDSSKHHDWGFVLHLFREFLFASPGSPRLSRAVFGYD
jgi:hypothetical protein